MNNYFFIVNSNKIHILTLFFNPIMKIYSAYRLNRFSWYFCTNSIRTRFTYNNFLDCLFDHPVSSVRRPQRYWRALTRVDVLIAICQEMKTLQTGRLSASWSMSYVTAYWIPPMRFFACKPNSPKKHEE